MVRQMKSFAVRLWKDERGASLLEYSVLIGLIMAGVRDNDHRGRRLDQTAVGLPSTPCSIGRRQTVPIADG